MATAFLLLLLLFFSVFSTITTTTAQQTSRYSNNAIIPIDSSLIPTKNNINSSSSWLSRSGRFAFGFYPLQNGSFVVGIWFAGIPQKTVVWTAPVLVNQSDSNSFRLRLTGDQGLILQPTQGQEQSISVDISGSTISYASMLDTGNMVLYDSDSTITWQSFDSPTDTILQGQPLRAGGSLFSKASETDYSMGRFMLIMQHDGNLVAYPADSSQGPTSAYWDTKTSAVGDNVTVNLDEDGRLYLVDTIGIDIENVSPSDNKAANGTIFYRFTIDIDGIPRLYSYNLQDKKNSNWSVMWTPPIDKCAPKGFCGLNGYCIILDQKADCLCIPGFDFIDSGQKTRGCDRVVKLESCRRNEEELEQSQYTMNNITETTWKDNTDSVLRSTTEEECKASCLKDCYCEVVMFENKTCGKQKLPLSYGRRIIGGTVTTFIKVSTLNTNNATTREGPGGGGMIKKRKRSSNKKEFKWTILIAGISFVSGFLLVIAISGFIVISIGFRRVIGFYPQS